ncbi:MAG: hypothetical protein FVQ85_01360 [Planctomycetes bacterium]|nr:hypothetical protein [Planctomycetota bacterium]
MSAAERDSQREKISDIQLDSENSKNRQIFGVLAAFTCYYGTLRPDVIAKSEDDEAISHCHCEGAEGDCGNLKL